MKFAIFFLLFFSNYLLSQIKLTIENDVEIYFLNNEISLSDLNSNKKDYKFKVINNTLNYLIISREGFEKKEQYVLKKNKIIHPIRIFTGGRPDELNDEECNKEVIILKPKSEMKINNLNIFEIKANYNLNSKDKYFLVIKAEYNQNFAMLNLIGCEKIVKQLNNYKFINIPIFAKIPLKK